MSGFGYVQREGGEPLVYPTKITGTRHPQPIVEERAKSKTDMKNDLNKRSCFQGTPCFQLHKSVRLFSHRNVLRAEHWTRGGRRSIFKLAWVIFKLAWSIFKSACLNNERKQCDNSYKTATINHLHPRATDKRCEESFICAAAMLTEALWIAQSFVAHRILRMACIAQVCMKAAAAGQESIERHWFSQRMATCFWARKGLSRLQRSVLHEPLWSLFSELYQYRSAHGHVREAFSQSSRRITCALIQAAEIYSFKHCLRLFFFRWDISVICPVIRVASKLAVIRVASKLAVTVIRVASKLAVTVFTSLIFGHCDRIDFIFLSFQNNRSVIEKNRPPITIIVVLGKTWPVDVFDKYRKSANRKS